MAKAAEMGEDPSALTIEGVPAGCWWWRGGNLPPEPELDSGLRASQNEHDYGREDELRPDDRIIIDTGVSRALANMKLPEENMTDEFRKFLFKQQGVVI